VLPAQHRPYLTALYAFRDLRAMVTKVNLPGPEVRSAVLAKWREAWNALRQHTAGVNPRAVLSEINSIHVINDHLEVIQHSFLSHFL
jgi:hypothetical protein